MLSFISLLSRQQQPYASLRYQMSYGCAADALAVHPEMLSRRRPALPAFAACGNVIDMPLMSSRVRLLQTSSCRWHSAITRW